jgi:sigma-B regulation protein RsbU (phosphoserine phosphatase)
MINITVEAQDTPEARRIQSLTRLMAELEQTRRPTDTFEAIRRVFAGLYGPAAMMLISTQGLREGEYRLVQLRLGDQTAIDSDPWRFTELPVRTGGVVARIIRDARPRIIDDVDWTADPLFAETLADYRSVMAVPVMDARVPIDWFMLLKSGGQRYTGVELEQAVLRATLVGSLLASQALAEDLRKANERIDADARQVGELQRALLPEPLPQIQGLQIAVSYEPSGRAGGDWYDLFPLDDHPSDGRWCIFVGDASGHGLAAAVVMAIVQSILRIGPARVRGPADLLAYANRQLCRKRIGGFVTAFLGVYDPTARRLAYASAGHPPPLLSDPIGGGVTLLDRVASYPIGIEESETFKEAAVDLHSGDTLLLYTDGITEARGPGGAMFEAERLETELAKQGGSPQELIEHLRGAISRFQEGQPPVDDQTLLAALCV